MALLKSPSPNLTIVCANPNNAVLYCSPVAGETWVSGIWYDFRWNSKHPLFVNRGTVDLYLYQKNGDALMQNWTKQDNTRGRLSVQVPLDVWFPSPPDNFNHTYPFYFIVIAN